MAYSIQALVARAGSFGTALPAPLRIVRLDGGMEMIPLGREARAGYGIDDCPLLQENYEREAVAPAALLVLCEDLSRNGAVAYIEAEFFGGAGTQASMVFSDGKQMAAPVRAENAINEALRLLGVDKSGAYDEFDAVRLGRHRHTEDWLQHGSD